MDFVFVRTLVGAGLGKIWRRAIENTGEVAQVEGNKRQDTQQKRKLRRQEELWASGCFDEEARDKYDQCHNR